MSPQSKVRKKKQGAVRGRRSEQRSPYAPLLESAANLREVEHPVLAESWASELMASLWVGAWQFDDPAEAFAEQYEDLVDALAEIPEPTALTTLRALSGVGDAVSRALAAESAEVLAAQGVEEPAWYTPEPVEFVDAYRAGDLLGDLEAVAVTYARGGKKDTIMFLCQSVLGTSRIDLFDTPADGTAALLRDMVSSNESAFVATVTPLTAEEVFDRIWPDIDEFYSDEPEEEAAQALLEGDAEHPIQLFSLAEARIGTLVPEGYEPAERPDHSAEVVEAFAALQHADAVAARRFAEIATTSAVEAGRDADEFGPAALSATLIVDFAAALEISDEDLALFGDLVREWAYFTADRRGLPRAQARAEWDERLPEVLEDFTEAYTDPEVAQERTGKFR